MGVILDARTVENAEPIRVVIYPNKKRVIPLTIPKELDIDKKVALIEEQIESAPEYEYYTDMVITYDLKDSEDKSLGSKRVRHEIDVSKEVCTVDTTKEEFNTVYDVKVKADVLELSGVDITK